MDGNHVRRVVTTALAVVLSYEVVGSLASFSEACNDGYEFEYGMARLTEWIIWFAPMNLSILLIPLLVGILVWLRTRRELPSGIVLVFLTGFVALGWLGLAMSLQMYKSVMDLDGHREPTVSMWISNLGVSALLIWLIVREWRKGGLTRA
jgi:hypothetical protein